jgi:acid stress-induced BolA-like protein IbaG/YrbA
MSKVKVQRALTRGLKLKEPKFRLERWGDRVYGSVISPTFGRMDDLQRQRSIWSALEAELGLNASRQVGMILAYTPDEWDLNTPESAGNDRFAGNTSNGARSTGFGSTKSPVRTK